jgi:hypothetical protein
MSTVGTSDSVKVVSPRGVKGSNNKKAEGWNPSAKGEEYQMSGTIIPQQSNKIAILVRCPTDLPIAGRPACFFNDASGNCERCTYPLFREKYESDLIEARGTRKTVLEEMNRT